MGGLGDGLRFPASPAALLYCCAWLLGRAAVAYLFDLAVWLFLGALLGWDFVPLLCLLRLFPLLLLLRSPHGTFLLQRLDLPLAKFPKPLRDLLIPHLRPQHFPFPTFLDEPPAYAPPQLRFHRRPQNALRALHRRLQDQPPQRPHHQIEQQAPQRAHAQPAPHPRRARVSWIDQDHARVIGLAVRALVVIEMFLERVGEDHRRQFTGAIFPPRRERAARIFQLLQISADVARARREHDPDIPIGRLRAQRRGEDAEEVEIRQVVHAPADFELFGRDELRPEPRREGVGAEDDHVEAAGRRVVDPFGGEEADGMEGGEVDLLGVDELVVGRGAQVIDVVDEKGIGGRETCQKDYACAPHCKGVGYRGTDPGCSALGNR